MELPLGPGDGCRLLAPGAPDWIGADGARIGWAVRDRLFLLNLGEAAPRAHLVVLPDLVEEVSPHPEGWVIALGQGFVRIHPGRGEAIAMALDDESDPVTTRAGHDVGLFIEVPEHRLIRLVDGLPIPLPYGATRARRIRPWATGIGAAWVDLDVVYRMGEKVQVVGRSAGADGLAVGPGGALLVSHRAGSLVAAPRALGLALDERLDTAHVRFNTDGTRLLAASEDGAVEVDLVEGVVLRRWDGSFQPVGWALVPGTTPGAPARSSPVLLDGDRGALVDDDGRVLLEGFVGALPSRAGDLLAGPGGTVWNLRSRQPDASRTQGAVTPDGSWADGVTATDGERVVVVGAGEVRVLDGIRFPVTLEDGDDEIAVARIEGDQLFLATLDGETARFRLADGALISRTREKPPAPPAPDLPAGVTAGEEGEDSELTIGEVTWPVPADGACLAGAPGIWWAWTREGMLLQLV